MKIKLQNLIKCIENIESKTYHSSLSVSKSLKSILNNYNKN